MARILLIDDEADVRKTIRQLLEEAGHEVDEATDANDAVARYEEAQTHDMIITDVLMPGRSGVDLILEFKRRHPELKIIAISGGGAEKDLSDLHEAGDLGADHVLTKPVLAEHLFEFVDDCLTR